MLIENATVLAGTTFVGGILIWKKLPTALKKWLARQTLLTDVVMFIVAYVVLGGTTTALLASAMLGVMVSGVLFIANNPDHVASVREWVEKAKASIVSAVQ